MLVFLGGVLAGFTLTTATIWTKNKITKNNKHNTQLNQTPRPKRELDLSTLTIDKLKEMARKSSIKGYYSMTKRELIEAIEAVKKEVKETAKDLDKQIKKIK